MLVWVECPLVEAAVLLVAKAEHRVGAEIGN